MDTSWKLYVATCTLGFLIGLAPGSEAFAQRGGDGDRGDRGGRGSWGGGGYSRGPSSQGGSSSHGGSSSDRYTSFLKSMDSNHDGRIDENEAEGRRRYFVEMMARRAGIEPKFPISVEKLQQGMQSRSGSHSGSSSHGSSSHGSSSRGDDDRKDDKKKAEDEERLVPGFGVEGESAEEPEVPKFGVRIENSSSMATRLASTRSSGSGGSRSSGEASEKIRRWAEGLIRQYDHNRNGRIDRDEMHRMKDEHRRADRNRDGTITRDEMTAALAAYARNRSRDSRSGSDGEGGFSVADRWADRNSYRFLSPLERLPEGLPEWFLSKDTDADGQIAMAEYATDWSTPRAAEANVTGFRRFDLNGDGIITPKECIAAEEAAELADAATETSAGGTTTPSRTHDPRQPARSEPAKVWSGW